MLYMRPALWSLHPNITLHLLGSQMLDLAVKLIKAGVLYADDTPVEQMREVCLNPRPKPSLWRTRVAHVLRGHHVCT